MHTPSTLAGVDSGPASKARPPTDRPLSLREPGFSSGDLTTLVQNSRPYHESIQRLLQFVVLCVCGSVSRNQRYIPALHHTRFGHGAPEPTFDPVPRHCIPDTTPHDESIPGARHAVPSSGQHEQVICPATANSSHHSEVARFPQASFPKHAWTLTPQILIRAWQLRGCKEPIGYRHRQTRYVLEDRSCNVTSHGKFVSPFEHSALHHIASIPGAHSRPESVDAHAPSFSGLIRSFWHYLLPQISTNYSDSEFLVSIGLFAPTSWRLRQSFSAHVSRRQMPPVSIPAASSFDTKLPITIAQTPLWTNRNCVTILEHKRS